MPAPLPEGHEPLIASRYRVLALLGEGGMGSVYRVRDETQGGRLLALKRLGLGAQVDTLRFRREFHTLANLRHPGIVQVYEFGVEPRGPFYTMELMEGRDLSEVGSLPVPTALRVLRDVAETLAFIHSRRLIHRDLTPRNIRLDDQGRARLLDFGILSTLGVPGEVAGTPPYIAPETLRQQPLDQRTDLFSFGALAYWLLTGKHAFSTSKLEQLEAMWSRPPVSLRELQPQAPAELEALVHSLLSVDPQRRPRSAAEVVERLDALLGERHQPHDEVAQGYLASPPLVGRRHEVALVEQLLERTTQPVGRGSVLLVQGETGSGKSRMLREVALHAQVVGARVVQARAESGSQPYALVQALVRSLFATDSAEATAAAQGLAPVLARFPVLTPLLSTPPAAPLEDAAEERLRLLSALAEWLVALCRERPLVLVVDDVHAADESSLALLVRMASLTPRNRLLLAFSCTAEVRAGAPETLSALHRMASRMYLHPLKPAQVEELLRGTFGEAAELKALAHWLYRSSHGSPLHTIELARHLVERGTVRYLDGMWLVGELSGVEAPALPTDAFAVRLARLPPRARALAEALAVHESELPLHLCVGVMEEPEDVVFSLLDELVRADVLVGSGLAYRFRHAVLRQALLSALPPERRVVLHRAMGLALQRLGLAELREQTGWHLLWGKEELAGAALLEAVGRKRFEGNNYGEAVPLLEAAVEAYERAGVRPRAVLEMRFRLAYCGAIANREALQRHAYQAVQGLFEAAGLWWAQRLRRYVGPSLALVLGLGAASVRWLFTLPVRPTVPPFRALVDSVLVLACTSTTYNTLNDLDAVERDAKLAEVAAVWPSRIPYCIVLYLRNMLAGAQGDWATLERNARHSIHVLHTDRLTPLGSQFVRLTEAALRIQQMLPMWLLRQQPQRFNEELQAVGPLQIHATAAYQVCLQAAFHRLRGEEPRALELDEQAEMLILQLGAGWGMDVLRTNLGSMAYALTRDVLGLKRTAEKLGRLVEQGAAYGGQLGLVRGDHHRERGVLEEAEAVLKQALAEPGPREEMLRQGLLAALAETELALGKAEQALGHAREAVGLGALRQPRNAFHALRAERALALALAASGEVAEARRRLEDALEAVREMDNPLLTGVLHEALAKLAGQEPAAQAHREAMERCYAATGNPVLLRRVQPVSLTAPERTGAPALGEDVATQRLEPAPCQGDVPGAAPGREVTLVADGAGMEERAARALALLLAEAEAEVGYLFLSRFGLLELAAPTSGAEPAAELARACMRLFEAARRGQGEHERLEADGRVWHVVPLWGEVLERREVLGLVALGGGERPYRELPAWLREKLALELWRSGDVTTVFPHVG